MALDDVLAYTTHDLRGGAGNRQAAGNLGAEKDQPPRDLEDLAVELWTADGEKLIQAVQSNAGAGSYVLPLDEAPWEAYRVSAVVRLRLDGESLGEVTIPVNGLDGIYPNDVRNLMPE